MAQKPKAGGAKKPPPKTAAKKVPKEKTQRERFIEAARKAGVDETGAEFERALATLAPARPRQKTG